MSAPGIFSGTITTLKAIGNMPEGRRIAILTDADITLAFWNPAKKDYAASEAITAPGARFWCPNAKARITAAAPADVAIIQLND